MICPPQGKIDSISVLTTLYNHAKYIGDAIGSAVGQTSCPDEIIVIDDHSTDGSVSAVKRLLHPCVRLIEQPRNLGGLTTVKGLLECRGDAIAILNSDDYWAPQKLERQVEYMRAHPKCGVVFTRVCLIDERGAEWKAHEHPLQATLAQPNRTRVAWLRHLFTDGNAFCASSALIRRACLNELGPLDGRFVQLQDLELWVRLVTAGYEMHVLDEPLTCYRVTRNGSNLSTASRQVRAREAYEYALLLRNYWRLQSATELFSIFPNSGWDQTPDDLLTHFYLAHIARMQGTPHHRQFAADTMFQLAQDYAAMDRAAELFGFSHSAYREFMSDNPLGMASRGGLWRRSKLLFASCVPNRRLRAIRRLKRRLMGQPEI